MPARRPRSPDPFTALANVAPGMNKVQWAKDAGITRDTLYRALRGDDTVGAGTVARLLDLAGYDVIAVPRPARDGA